MQATATQTPLHAVGRFDDPHTGAERSLPDLALALRGLRDTVLWSDVAVHPAYAVHGVRALAAAGEAGPRGGTLLIGGVHVQLGSWLDAAGPQRIVLRYNLPNHQRLFEAIARIRTATGLEPELAFVSAALQQAVGLPGRVEPSLIRLEHFLAHPLPREPRKTLTIGRISRDVIEKHDPRDIALYRLLAARGWQVRIMGGLCLAPMLAAVPGIALLPAGAEPAHAFLHSLDVFFYRTGSFVEPYGRVVFEAMATGLPVVAGLDGGYAEQIRQGVDGILVDSQEQALQALHALATQAALRLRISAAARETAIRLHGDAAIARVAQNYLGDGPRSIREAGAKP
jgi:glycosyltransferase involved in cell wall biosynthesis